MQDEHFAARSEFGHDPSLIRWFADLTPDQRLAELESRVAFLQTLRAGHDTQLSRNTRSSQPTRG